MTGSFGRNYTAAEPPNSQRGSTAEKVSNLGQLRVGVSFSEDCCHLVLQMQVVLVVSASFNSLVKFA